MVRQIDIQCFIKERDEALGVIHPSAGNKECIVLVENLKITIKLTESQPAFVTIMHW